MEVPLKAGLINYFLQLETTHSKWQDFAENVKRSIQGLKNQSEQYCHVISKEVDNAEICKMPGLREKLLFKISAGIEDEVCLILNELQRLKNYVEALKKKYNRLEAARSDATLSEPCFKELIDGTAHIPRLDLLMEWSIDTRDHYNRLFTNIFENFKFLDYRNHEKVNDWAKSIDGLLREQERIKYVLGFTQFLIKESAK